MKVALVYDRVNKWGGAERVLLALNELFPEAPLYTSVYSNESAAWANVFPKIHTSFIQKIPWAKTNHEYLPWLMPKVFESFDFRQYDLVISVTSESAKGIITHPNTKHICYCLTPTRYLWSGHEDYFPTSFKRTAAQPLIRYLRSWDQVAAHRPDTMIAISTEVQNRIKKYYSRDATIIFPPTPLGHPAFNAGSKSSRSYYLLVSRLVPYKKVDLAINAFNALNQPLVNIGNGKDESRLKNIANKNIKFLSKLTDRQLGNYYMGAKALIFPQNEDFGLVTVEAQSFGVPVIAFRGGGALDTVIDGDTGVFFNEQTIDSLIDAINRFEKMSFERKLIKQNAERFSKEIFKENFLKTINEQ